MEWYIHTDVFYDGYKVYLRDKNSGKYIKLVLEIDQEYEDGMYREPSIILTQSETQNIMNELWKCGIRPHDGNGSSANVDAIKYHLEDMRKLVFGESHGNPKKR